MWNPQCIEISLVFCIPIPHHETKTFHPFLTSRTFKKKSFLEMRCSASAPGFSALQGSKTGTQERHIKHDGRGPGHCLTDRPSRISRGIAERFMKSVVARSTDSAKSSDIISERLCALRRTHSARLWNLEWPRLAS